MENKQNFNEIRTWKKKYNNKKHLEKSKATWPRKWKGKIKQMKNKAKRHEKTYNEAQKEKKKHVCMKQ